MRKLFKVFLALTAGLAIASCAKEYDDTELKGKVDALDKKVSTLEQKVNALSEQVTGIAATIEEWKKGGFVESIQEIEGGYTINFVGGKTVTLYNGKDGKDGTNGTDGTDGTNGTNGTNGTDGENGKTPQIISYNDELVWAIDGQPILVGGKPVPANVVPTFQIKEDGHLWMTLSGAETDLGKVVGEDGAGGGAAGDSILKSIEKSPDGKSLVFTLNGDPEVVYEIPFATSFKLVIANKEYETTAGATVKIDFEVQNGEGAEVDCFAGGLYDAKIVGNQVVVDVPNPFQAGKVLVWAQNDKGLSSMVKLSFIASAELVVVTPADEIAAIPAAAGDFEISLTSNVDVKVNEPAVDWVSAVITKADYTLTLTLTENETGEPRETDIEVIRKDNGNLVQKIHIVQLGVDLIPKVTIDFTAQGYANAQDLTNLTVDDITVTFDKATGANPPKYYTSPAGARTYAGNITTITSAKYYIKSIKITYDKSKAFAATPDSGALSTVDSSTELWTAAAEEGVASVAFTTDTGGQARYQKMIIYLGDEIPATPKELTIKTLFAKNSTDTEAWNTYYGGTPGTDRNIAMDDDYVYIAESSAAAKLWAISIADPNQAKLVNVEGVSGGAHALTCPRVVKNTDANVNGGKDVLICSNLTRGGEDPKLYMWANGIDNAPKAITLTTWATDNWYGDTFTVWGTLQDGVLLFDKTDGSGNGVVTFLLNGVPAGSSMYLVGRIKTVDAFGSHTGVCAFYPIPDGTAGVYSPGRGTEARGQFATLGNSLKTEGGIAVTLSPLDYDEGTNGFVLGYNFVEWEGYRYVVYGNFVNNKTGYVRVRQGELTDSWNKVASTGTRLYRRDLVSGGLAASNSGMDITTRVINGDLYIAAQMQNVGFGLYKLCYE